MINNGTVKQTQAEEWAIRAMHRLQLLMKDIHEGQEMTIIFKRKGNRIIMVTPKEEVLG